MNEKKAKLLRRKVYNNKNNYRERSYYEGVKRDIIRDGKIVAVHVTVWADQLRQLYQRLKRISY